MGGEARSRRQDVRDAAAAWVVRLSDPACSDADRSAFEVWRGESPAHEAAFEREAAAWERLDRLRAFRPADPEPDADLLAGEGASPPVMRWAAAAVGALAIGAAVAWSFNAAPAYATSVGERRVVVLEDGTRVELNTDTRIVVRYRGGERSVKLVRGEALFEVAPDATRPFVVTAKDKRVTAKPGAVNVRVEPDGVEVIVARGSAEVGEADLPAGVIGLYSEEGGVSRVATPDKIDKALAWRHGQIALDGQTLETAVDEFNRYSKRRLVIADPSIAGYRLGGYFRVDDMDGFVSALKTTFPVKSTATDRTIYLSAAG